MFTIRKIICPTDFSEAALEGIEAAIAMAEKWEAELVLTYVVSPLPIMTGSSSLAGYHLPAMVDEMEQDASAAIANLAADKIPSGLCCQTRILRGKPAEEISQLAATEKADLIVIATHGESGLQRFLFGSVTERVFKIAHCPVLTIRPQRSPSR